MAQELKAQYLTTATELQSFAQRAAGAPWLALDTEFVRERTYHPQLCLIQMATPEEIVLVDVLSISDFAPLAALLDGGPLKILHAPGQDFEALATVGIQTLRPLFDSQLAHALLGGPAQMGYAGLVSQRLLIDLEKDQTRTDWSRRPLSTAQCEYAADDVRYLGALYEQLWAALQQQGRDEWLRQDMQALELPYAAPDPRLAAQRSRALGRMDETAQSVFVALSLWRDARARKQDRPRSWIAKDALLTELAHRRPETAASMEAIESLPPALLRKQGEVLLNCITEAIESPLEMLQAVDRNALKDLQARVASRAGVLRVETAVLATKGDLEQWLRDESGRLGSGWRAEVLAADLADFKSENALEN